jgi:hypothetical protein
MHPNLDRRAFLTSAAGATLCGWLERLPSGLKAAPRTAPVCPLTVRSSRPVSASHTFTVWSCEALARRLPSGLEATLRTPSRVPAE